MTKLLFLGTLLVILASCGSSSFILEGSNKASISTSETITSGTPTSIKMNVFALWLCKDNACTDCVLVDDNGDTPVEHDLALNETLYEGNPEDGTYNCMILKAYDTMKFTPDSEAESTFGASVCSSSSEYTFDTYRTGLSDEGQWLDKDGNKITSHGTVEEPKSDIVYFFITTDITKVNAHEHQVIKLNNPVEVPGSAVLYVDFTDQVSNNNGHCWLETPVMGVR